MAINSENEKYAYLNRLSTEQLEELLRADIGSSDDSNMDVIFYILEVIEKREEEHPSGRIPDVDNAWAEFQKFYNIPEGNSISLYPCEQPNNENDHDSVAKQGPLITTSRSVYRHRWIKQGILVAIIAATIFMGMVAAQAAGIDVFGAIGRWTEETFHFETFSNSDMQDNVGAASDIGDDHYYALMKTALNDCGIAQDLAPTWYLEGFESSGPEVTNNEVCNKVFCIFNDTNDNFFSVQVKQYTLSSDMESLVFEKDNTAVEEYYSGGRAFYIIANLDTTTANWSDGSSIVMSISGNIPEEDIKAIIDSIGG
ncbi:MAG: DUF4367 domain-containing protein [Bacillota bacterium]